MTTTPLSIHTTKVTRSADASGEVWEFSCELCSYRTRYYLHDHGSGTGKLEVVSFGDEQARHTNNSNWTQVASEQIIALGNNGSGGEAEVSGDTEIWLPPDLCAQIEAILRRTSFGS